jgi:hypothetical protein
MMMNPVGRSVCGYPHYVTVYTDSAEKEKASWLAKHLIQNKKTPKPHSCKA